MFLGKFLGETMNSGGSSRSRPRWSLRGRLSRGINQILVGKYRIPKVIADLFSDEIGIRTPSELKGRMPAPAAQIIALRASEQRLTGLRDIRPVYYFGPEAMRRSNRELVARLRTEHAQASLGMLAAA